MNSPLLVQKMQVESSNRARSLSFGQAGLALATALALVSLGSTDGLLWWAVTMFASTIPLGLGHGLLCQDFALVPFSTPGWRVVLAVMSTATHLSMFIGVYLIFLHVSILPALIFGSLSLGVWFVWRLQHRLLDRIESGIREGRLIPDTDAPKSSTSTRTSQ